MDPLVVVAALTSALKVGLVGWWAYRWLHDRTEG